MDINVAGGAPILGQDSSIAAISRMLTDSRAIPVVVLRGERVTFANPAFCALFGREDGMSGLPAADLFTTSHREAALRQLRDLGGKPATWSGRAQRGDGSSFDIELHLAPELLDGVPAVCAFAEDISSRRLSEAQLSTLAYADSLTGLPNRPLMLDRMREAIATAIKQGTQLAVLMIDLDGLKRVNDTLGHQSGDVLIQIAAQRFRGCIRESDTLARFGGDEFCLLLPRLREPRDAEPVAARLVEVARAPVPMNGEEIRTGASVGIALAPDHGRTPEAVIAAADHALYAAKRTGKGRFVWATADSCPPVVALPLINWTVAHEVGVREIDEQHRYLADQINELDAALRRGAERVDIDRLLERLVLYTQFHFATEEHLMEAGGIEDTAAHRETHAHLLDDLRNFSAAWDSRSLSLTTRYIQEWLLRHIESSDRRMARQLQAQGTRDWTKPASP